MPKHMSVVNHGGLRALPASVDDSSARRHTQACQDFNSNMRAKPVQIVFGLSSSDRLSSRLHVNT